MRLTLMTPWLANANQGAQAAGGMADVFISYKKEDKSRVSPLVAALEARGYSVWWDQEIDAGEEWFRRILSEVRKAKLTIGVWSAGSVDEDRLFRPNREGKRYVEIEHDETPEGSLIPVLLDAGRIPLTYKHVQAVDLTGWGGDAGDARLGALWRRVTALAGARAVPEPPEAPSATLRVAPPPQAGEDISPRANGGSAAEPRGGPSSQTSRQAPLDPLAGAAAPARGTGAKGLPRWALPAVAAIAVAFVIGSLALSPAPSRERVAAEQPGEGSIVVADPSPPTPSPQGGEGAFLDARTTPSSTRVPITTVDPATLPDFALFRECEGCPEMVVIPAGSFLMGSPADEVGRNEDEDDTAGPGGGQVSVQVPRFAIARFETTWEQWTACVNAGACNSQGQASAARAYVATTDIRSSYGTAPVVFINTNDAIAYANFVNGRVGSTNAYRLPTEAEWEYAARAGTSTRWSFGDTESQLGAYAWFDGNSMTRTHPVGGKLANTWGLFDMYGNVLEWVEDCYSEGYLAQPQVNISQCLGGVFRGGAWSSDPDSLRSANRDWSSPRSRLNTLGFRAARTL